MSALDKIGVACTAIGNRLIIYRRGKDPQVALDQRDAEPEIMKALVEHMLKDFADTDGATKMVTFGPRSFEITVKPFKAADGVNDKSRMDWLEQQVVEVRTPLVHGSRAHFFANPDDSYEGETGPSDLRAKVDAALKAADGAPSETGEAG